MMIYLALMPSFDSWHVGTDRKDWEGTSCATNVPHWNWTRGLFVLWYRSLQQDQHDASFGLQWITQKIIIFLVWTISEVQSGEKWMSPQSVQWAVVKSNVAEPSWPYIQPAGHPISQPLTLTRTKLLLQTSWRTSSSISLSSHSIHHQNNPMKIK